MNLYSLFKQKAFQWHEYYVFDGIDGIGKTTQINLLKNYYENKGYKVFKTRSLGGAVGSECEKLRDFIINNNFSKRTEETLLATSSWLNLLEICNQISEHAYPHHTSKPLVILQDRGVLSHLSYAQNRGFSRNEALDIHGKNISVSDSLRAKNIILMPLNIDVIMERVKARGDVGIFHEKYEQEAVQLNVLNRMIIELTRTNKFGIRSMGRFDIVKVSAEDQPLDVHQKVLECLNLK